MDEKPDNAFIQQRGLDILARHKGGFQFTNTFFPYTSGEIGPYYVQSGVVQNDGMDYYHAISDMSALVERTICRDCLSQIVISGGETRDWIFSNPVSVHLSREHNKSIPSVMLYKDGKTVGADIKGKELVHIADLNNEGSSPRDYWKPIIEKAGGTVKHIFFYVDRMEEGVLGDYGLSLGNGYLIHGTLYTRLLGRNVTHGCVRVGDKDLKELYKSIPIGTKVIIF